MVLIELQNDILFALIRSKVGYFFLLFFFFMSDGIHY